MQNAWISLVVNCLTCQVSNRDGNGFLERLSSVRGTTPDPSRHRRTRVFQVESSRAEPNETDSGRLSHGFAAFFGKCIVQPRNLLILTELAFGTTREKCSHLHFLRILVTVYKYTCPTPPNLAMKQ